MYDFSYFKLISKDKLLTKLEFYSFLLRKVFDRETSLLNWRVESLARVQVGLEDFVIYLTLLNNYCTSSWYYNNQFLVFMVEH